MAWGHSPADAASKDGAGGAGQGEAVAWIASQVEHSRLCARHASSVCDDTPRVHAITRLEVRWSTTTLCQARQTWRWLATSTPLRPTSSLSSSAGTQVPYRHARHIRMDMHARHIRMDRQARHIRMDVRVALVGQRRTDTLSSLGGTLPVRHLRHRHARRQRRRPYAYI